MILGETFNMDIVKIISEERLNRVVKVRLVREFYDGKKEETVGFLPTEWEVYKKRGNYPDTRALDERGIDFYEKMSDQEWYQSRFGARLSNFSDEEIVDEFNRRLKNNFSHHIRIESYATITKKD